MGDFKIQCQFADFAFAEHFYTSYKETYEQHIAQLMEVIRGLRASQEQTQAANQLLLAEIRALRELLDR